MPVRAMSCLLSAAVLAACGGGGGGGGESAATPSSPAPVQVQPSTQAPQPAQSTRLVTLIGSPESSGLHWILVGDGFTTTELPELREAALDLAQSLLGTPELAAHGAVWNVHLLEAASRDSGVDDAAAGIFKQTAFDGSLGCGTNSRIACVDWSRINSALAAHSAPVGTVTVILNTAEYVGSSNVSGIIVSRNEHAPRVTVHEMGHRVAGLADEYVDAAVAAEWLPLYVEGKFPNVTTATDPAAAPWRHWTDDPASGVGLFEGAFYAPSGYYRPKRDSLMRTLEAPLGEVNAEAWLRAQYRAVPLVTVVTPASARVQGTAGDMLAFTATTPWPADVVTLRWYVDGVERIAARDASRFEFGTDGGDHDVELRAWDLSGRIRAPGATEARVTRTWRVSATTGSAGKAEPGASQARGPGSWLRVRVDSTGQSVVAWRRAGNHATLASTDGEDWRYTLLDVNGEPVASGSTADPRIVRSAIPAPGEPLSGHAIAVLESGEFLVPVPAGAMPRKLRITPTAAAFGKLGSSGIVRETLIEIGLDPP